MAFYIVRRLREPGGRRRYVVFKVAVKDGSMRRGTSLSGLCSRYNYEYLDELIPRACISSRYLGRFMDEREFVDAMKELINGCPAVLEKGRVMARVLRFVREPAFEEFRSRCPVIVSGGRRLARKMLPSVVTSYTGYYNRSYWRFYAFNDYFCVHIESSDVLLCAPYSSETLDPGAVASLTRDDVALLGHVIAMLSTSMSMKRFKHVTLAISVCEEIIKWARLLAL